MLRQNSSCINWHLLLVGLFFVILRCDARAVNVSNTWTMPQEGLNVFYRFFRDRISWFEADAVCQFHHANLVTVDNSFQFDATRDLLRELDVNDIVWIGLMRPQSSDRFMWSTSRPLVADTGYWAESLPLMDAPLCAVIDPIRDYRWHALRCGGPETASFLCEMPVPIWADACNLKDMPNLTLQYMADTASIELVRNCQEEGLLRTMCRGKQDRERALQDLVCPRERLEAQRINDITNSHFKSLQIINSIPSDNNENNDIELLPMEINYGPHYPEELQTEKNTVQRLIEQFNVDELMQADEPSNMETVSSFYKIPGLIPKPVKKSSKKVLDYPKKDNGKQQNSGMSVEKLQKDQKRLPVIMEEMMMGDQPLQGEPEIPEQFLNEEVSNEILEPLPHIKKTNIHKEDGLEKMEKEAIAMKKSMQKNKEMENKKYFMMSATITTTQTTPTTESETTITTSTTNKPILADKSTTEDYAHVHNHETHKKVDNAGAQLTTATPPSIGHPIHPQQPRSNVMTEESQHSHTKEAADNSHFIPPMLMVKSHYIPPASKHGHSEHDHHHHNQQHQQHEAEKSQIENTTKEQAATTIKQEQNQNQNQTFDMVTMVPTTPKVLDSQTTTLKTLDTLISSKENERQFAATRQEENQAALTTAKVDSSMKPITEQHTTETEQSKNSKNLYFEEKQTTMTATTLQPDAFTSVKHIVDDEMTLAATNSEGINKNIAGHEIKEEEIPKFMPPQKKHTDDDTSQTTKLVATTEKSLKYTEKLYNLETTTDSREKTEAIADDTKTVEEKHTEQAQPQPLQQQQQQQQHELTMEEKLIAIKNEETKEHLQTTTGTTEKQAATQTAEVITTSTTVSALATQQTPETTTTTKAEAEAQDLQQIEKDKANKENLQESKEKEQEKKETIVKTTEIQVTSITSALTEAKQEYAKKPTITTSTVYTPAISTSRTTTTTVKPITTTLPQNEVKSTDTSVSSTNTITSTTTNIPTSSAEDTTSTTTTTAIIPTTSTSSSVVLLVSSPVTIAKTTREIKTKSTTTAATTTSTSTQTQRTSPPETTRNFLKVTTEIPFKPNRRRSLTKPETVSYMKKILG